jgi:hypothetical protein
MKPLEVAIAFTIGAGLGVWNANFSLLTTAKWMLIIFIASLIVATTISATARYIARRSGLGEKSNG